MLKHVQVEPSTTLTHLKERLTDWHSYHKLDDDSRAWTNVTLRIHVQPSANTGARNVPEVVCVLEANNVQLFQIANVSLEEQKHKQTIIYISLGYALREVQMQAHENFRIIVILKLVQP